MGFTNIMKLQENPDGIDGHNERDVFQEISKCAPAKTKFTRGKGYHDYTVPTLTKTQQRFLDLESMKLRCDYVVNSCNIKNCPTCGRPDKMRRKESVRGRDELISLRLRDPTNDKITYWDTRIAFPCPLTNKDHQIKDCFRWCKRWGARVDFESNPRGITLYCNMNPNEKRELHSGNIVEVKP